MTTRPYWLLVFLVWCGVSFGLPSRPAETIAPNLNTPIRVLLERRAGPATLQSPHFSLYFSTGNAVWKRFSKEMKIDRVKQGFRVNRKVIAEKSFYVRGGALATDRVLYNGRKYRGALRFTLRGEVVYVTNILALEDYLEGMLASEMSPSWEMEALKAQAVAARSYALYMMRHPKDPLFDLEDGIQDQVYGGVAMETARVTKAVRETAGTYLGLQEEPVKAYFHSRCGGLTETAQSVWKYNAQAHRHRVHCPYCQKNKFTWQASLSFAEFFKALNLSSSPSVPFRILPQVSPSGRVALIKIEAGSESKIVSSDEFRSLLGYTRIKSAFFDWKVGKEMIHFEGTGAGHGVGMCQWGARGFAREGKSHRDILTYYYPGVLLYKR